MAKRSTSQTTTYRVVKLGDNYTRVFSESEWSSLSPDDQAQYETLKAGIATKEEAEAEIAPRRAPEKGPRQADERKLRLKRRGKESQP